MKKALFLLKSPPYGTLRATEGYRAAMGASAMGIPTTLVLLGDGVYAAKKGQDPSAIDQSSVEAMVRGLVDAGVAVYLHEPSLVERRLGEGDVLPLPAVSPDELRRLIGGAHAVMTF